MPYEVPIPIHFKYSSNNYALQIPTQPLEIPDQNPFQTHSLTYNNATPTHTNF